MKEALGITMFGSAEGAVRICSAMWMSGLASKGASTPIRMPLPGVNVLLALLQHHCPELSVRCCCGMCKWFGKEDCG